MNILYISVKKSWRGVTSWVVKTALALNKRGHHLYLLSHPKSKINKSLPLDIKLIEKRLGPSYNPVMIGYLVYFIITYKIDLIVTNIDKEVAIGGIAARLTGIPNIRRVGREDDFNNRFRSKWCHKLLVDSCIVPCQTLIRNARIRAPWLNPAQFKVIYNGRDISEFSPEIINLQRLRMGVNPGIKILGINSHLHRKKHVEHLIQAFARIAPDFKNWVLVIVGTGPEERNLRNLAIESRLTERIIFFGFVENPMLICSTFDIAFSVSKIEGFPNTIVEYMAMGRPVIATDVGGVREIIRDGINGFVVPFGDQRALVDRMVRLMTHEEMRQQFSREAIKTVRESFTEKQMIDDLEKYLKGIVKHR
ncbi:MAG TPA: glycosyltransferase family 1 protein [Candidatus Marinimicrobia bacterium]|nr:glycosyltransferase family 1 protein [Candidatus Neomarinimicrobiota bacterium]